MTDPSLHRRLAGRELAADRRTLSGTIDAAELAPRVGEALAREHPAGSVDYELSFAPGPGDGVAVTGRLRARLEATCQRCLRPFALDMEVPVDVLLEAGDGASQTESGPAWDVAENVASLAELMEEELLLALPFLPRHPPQDCPSPAGRASGADAGAGDDVQRPFAGLRDALDAARGDEED